MLPSCSLFPRLNKLHAEAEARDLSNRSAACGGNYLLNQVAYKMTVFFIFYDVLCGNTSSTAAGAVLPFAR